MNQVKIEIPGFVGWFALFNPTKVRCLEMLGLEDKVLPGKVFGYSYSSPYPALKRRESASPRSFLNPTYQTLTVYSIREAPGHGK